MGYTPQGHEESDTTEVTWHTHTVNKEGVGGARVSGKKHLPTINRKY